jgi:MoaA/NifB/PqqE/SkfB family radical SAM enzyme
MPKRIVFELTNRCNLKCEHCFSGRHGGDTDLSVAIIEKALAEAPQFGFGDAAFTGGDPTVHPRFAGILKLTRDAGWTYGFVTNGWNFETIYPRIADLLRGASAVTFSLDGATEATHDRLRGAGSFRRVMKAFAICVGERIPFTINMVVTRHNRAEMREMADLASKLGAQGLRYGHLMPSFLTTVQGFDLTPWERKQAEAEISELQRDFPIRIATAPGTYTTDLAPCAPLNLDEINIDCRGNFSKCCHLSGHGDGVGDGDIMGSLAAESFADCYSRHAEDNRRIMEHKRRRLQGGEFKDSDFFPCWYCSLYYRKVDWLRKFDRHAWTPVMWQSGSLSSTPAQGGAISRQDS